MSAEDLKIKQLTLENIWLKKQIENLTEENKSIYNEYLNYMEYSELTILDLAVELNKLKGIDNTMSTSEFQELFNECKLNELDYYSS
ncbi:MAG: hypothetical protein E7208_09190 [Clostridium butyricum]|nr:hypothetical protein [Clostridium butyricum]